MKHFTTIRLRLLLLFTLYLVHGTAKSQTLPVSAQLVAIPPYSQFLSDYATGNNLQLHLIQRDLSREPQEVYLHVELEGNGIRLQTLPSFRPNNYIDLVPGAMVTITNSDLSEYFQLNNLNFEGQSREAFFASNQQLSEGLYKLKIKAFLKSTGSQCSNEAMALMGIYRGQPPLINLPQNNAKVPENSMQNFIIQWTNRNPASFNQVNIPSYRIQMWELLDPLQDPNVIVNSNYPPILDDYSTFSTYAYGPSNVPLTAGKSYAIRVQVLDPEGRDIYTQSGYSQVVRFTYGELCLPPQNVTAIVGKRGIQYNWSVVSGQGYQVQQARIDTAWSDHEVATNRFALENPFPAAQYKMQVATVCAADKISAYSPVVYASTLGSESNNNAACGDPFPDVKFKTKTLLPTLKIGDKFSAYDFDVTVTQVYKNDSTGYKGEGKTPFNMLGGIDVIVTFEDIQINTDHQLIDGRVDFQQKPYVFSDQKAKQFLDDFKETKQMFTQDDQAKPKDIYVEVSIATITYDSSQKQIVITDTHGNTVKNLESGKDYKITDVDGNVYLVSKDNQIVKQVKPTEVAVNNGGPVTEGGDNTSLYFGDGQPIISFEADPKQSYGFDATTLNSMGSTNYESIRKNLGTYEVTYKSIAAAGTDQVLAKLETNPSNVNLHKIKFKTHEGVVVPFVFDSLKSQWTLTLTGALHRQDFSVYPYYGSGKDTLCGKLNVIPLDEKVVQLVLIPLQKYKTTKLNITNIEQYLNKVYAQAHIRYKVSLGEAFKSKAADTPLSVEHSALAGEYSADQAQVITEYATKYGEAADNTLYLFLCDESNNSAIKGHTPVNRSYGFLFGKVLDLRTIAHEVGHGYPLALEHPFTEGGPTGTYTNLMDYASGTNLSFKQWGLAHNPKLKIRWGQNAEQGEYKGRIYFTPDWQPFVYEGNFILSANPNIPKGTVPNIIKDKKLYRAVFKGQQFIHYAYDATDILSLQLKNNVSAEEEVFLLEPKGNFSCYGGYSTPYQNITTLQKGPIDFSDRKLSYKYTTNGCEHLGEGITDLGKEVLNGLKFYYSDPQYAERFAKLTGLVKKLGVGFDLYFAKTLMDNNASILFDESYLDNLIKALEGQFGHGDIVKMINDPATTQQQLITALNGLGSGDPELDFAGFNIDQRIKMLQIIAKGKIRDEWIGFGNNGEGHVIWILAYTPQKDRAELLKQLEVAKSADGKKNLLYLLDQQMDGDKYMQLMTTISKLLFTASDFEKRGEDYLNHRLERTLNWGGNAKSFTQGYIRVKEGTFENHVSMDSQNGQIALSREEVYQHWVSSRDADGIKDLKIEEVSVPFPPDINLRPFDLVAFTNHNGLPEIDMATGAQKGEEVYVPAIVLVYANTKEFNENVAQTVSYAMDAATIISSAGTLTFAWKSLQASRKAWLAYELVCSVGNVVVNAAELNKDPELHTAVDVYNTLQLMVGGSEMLYQARKSAPAALLKTGKVTASSVQAVKEQAQKFMEAMEALQAKKLNLSDASAKTITALTDYKTQLKTKWKTWFGEEWMGGGTKSIKDLSLWAGKIIKGGNNIVNLPAPVGMFKKLVDKTKNTYSAEDFWIDINADFFHYLSSDQNYYIKHDFVTGRMLFVNVKKKEFVGFFLDEGFGSGGILRHYNESNLAQAVEDLKLVFGFSGKPFIQLKEGKVVLSSTKTNVFVGSFYNKATPSNTSEALELTKYLTNYDFGARKGGLQLLNVPEGMFKSSPDFWNEYNLPWLTGLADLPDVEFTVISDLTNAGFMFRSGKLSGFGMEVTTLLKRGDLDLYYDEVLKMHKFVKKGQVTLPKAAIDEEIKKHILKGGILNGDASGCHYPTAIDGNNVRYSNGASDNSGFVKDLNGVYEAKIDIKRFILKSDKSIKKNPDGTDMYKWETKHVESSFFPDGWDENKIISEIEFAYSNKKQGDEADKWLGISSEGIIIEGYIDMSTKKIKSAYPKMIK